MHVLMAEVTGTDVESQGVLLGEQALPYDYLIVATGVHDSYFGCADWAAYAPGLKLLAQATTIRGKLLLAFERAEREPDPDKHQALLTFVIVFLPSLIERSQLNEGNSKLEVSSLLANLAAPGLAGWLIQLVSAPLALLGDACSFLVSAYAL